jgi:hypothetical protein
VGDSGTPNLILVGEAGNVGAEGPAASVEDIQVR